MKSKFILFFIELLIFGERVLKLSFPFDELKPIGKYCLFPAYCVDLTLKLIILIINIPTFIIYNSWEKNL